MGLPFLFLGHGEGPGRFDVLVALADPAGDATALTTALTQWAQSGRDPFVQTRGPVVSARVTFKAGPKRHERLADVLVAVHSTTPLSIVVRTNRVKPSAWHAQSVTNPSAVLDTLERLVRASKPTYAFLPIDTSGSDSAHGAAYDGLAAHSLLGALVQQSLKLATTKLEPTVAAVWDDVLVTRLPALAGLDFGVDLAVQQRLALTLGLSPSAVEMPGHFLDAFDDMVRAHHEWAHQPRRRGAGDLDWSNVAAVRAALDDPEVDWARVESSFLDTNAAHVDSLLELTPDERMKLTGHGHLTTLMMNAATMLMTAGRYVDALALYDAALEGTIDPMAAANPLFAVQDDNNHLGVDAVRARHYLERCVPHGPKNPPVFLNAAFVAAELGEHDEAVRLLAQAKLHGVVVSRYRNEGLFVPLKHRADFKRLMT
ncbi:MAG: tetratricopeptide repeat protein [Myxococcales bacterium]|nr:tetratricopeptide repeat protein [Myxococcales bacterium]